MNALALLFHSGVRAEVLGLLFGEPREPMYRAEIIAQTKFAPASVEEELQKLERLDLLVSSRDGNRRYYSPNTAHRLFPELQAIVLKSSGRPVPKRSVPRPKAAPVTSRAPASVPSVAHPEAPAPVAVAAIDDEHSPDHEIHLR